jgi:hypothetical protein
LAIAYAEAVKHDDLVLVEEFVAGVELTASILNDRALPLIRIEAPHGNYDYHHKYFSVEDEQGDLAPHFIAVMNTNADPEGLVRRGNERVLRARFNDARFFWDADQRKKLADRLPDLAHVTFQAKLGSYLEKTERIMALVKQIGGNEMAVRAAQLSKCDLTTELVKEFTELQGIIGGLYARAQGEPESVAGRSTITTSLSAWRIRSETHEVSLYRWPTSWTRCRLLAIGMIPPDRAIHLRCAGGTG